MQHLPPLVSTMSTILRFEGPSTSGPNSSSRSWTFCRMSRLSSSCRRSRITRLCTINGFKNIQNRYFPPSTRTPNAPVPAQHCSIHHLERNRGVTVEDTYRRLVGSVAWLEPDLCDVMETHLPCSAKLATPVMSCLVRGSPAVHFSLTRLCTRPLWLGSPL